MLKGLCAAAMAGVLVTACAYRETKTVMVPATSENVCTSYGFTPGTAGYDNCITREVAARRSGRMARDYAESALVADSQNACTSYGLRPGSHSYEHCVRNEINARRYQ